MNTIKETFKNQLNFQAFITEKWFRIIEYSIILGGLKYFKDLTINTYISAIYWASWCMFYIWFLEIGEFIAELFYPNPKPTVRILILVLSTLPFILLAFTVTQVGEIISNSGQF